MEKGPTETFIDVSKDEPNWQDVTFVATNRVTRKGSTKSELPEELNGWVKLGAPIVRVLGSSSPNAVHQYGYVQLALSLRPADTEPFEGVWLKIRLSSSETEDTRRPIAWSLHPQSESLAVEVQTKLKLDGSLKFSGVGLGTGTEQGKKFTRKDAYLEAFNELRDDPLWEFKATEEMPIRGNHRLHMVVRYGAGSTCSGRVELAATIQRTKWGLVQYSAALAGLGSTQFELHG